MPLLERIALPMSTKSAIVNPVRGARMPNPVSDREAQELFQAVAGRAWEEATLMGMAIEMIVRQRMYIEKQQEVVDELMPTIEKQQSVLLRHGLI